jgi:choline-sulfatase
MSDQHRADFTGYEGHSCVRTPTLDCLAAEGSCFTSAYCPSPVCVPGRQCLSAGQLPWTCGAVSYGDDLPPFSMTFPRQLSRYGYVTACAGKLHHMGSDQMQGWTRRIGWADLEIDDRHLDGIIDSELARYPRSTPMWGLHKEIQMSGCGPHPYARNDELAVDGALHFIEQYFCDGVYDRQETNRPLLLKVSLMQPHYAYLTPDKQKYDYYLNRVKPFLARTGLEHPNLGGDWAQAVPGKDVSPREIQRAHAAYCAMIETVDEQFARVMAALEHAGQDLDDWLIIYTSDHGDMMGQYNLWWKLKFYEGSARVPLLIRLPGALRHKQQALITQNVSQCDLFATLCDLAEIPLPDSSECVGGRPLDSRSMKELLLGQDEAWPDTAMCQIGWNQLMIKKGNLKYCWYGDERPEVIFDLLADPQEQVNVALDAAYEPALSEFRRLRMQTGKNVPAS